MLLRVIFQFAHHLFYIYFQRFFNFNILLTSALILIMN
jgi:hypothetical protein